MIKKINILLFIFLLLSISSVFAGPLNPKVNISFDDETYNSSGAWKWNFTNTYGTPSFLVVNQVDKAIGFDGGNTAIGNQTVTNASIAVIQTIAIAFNHSGTGGFTCLGGEQVLFDLSKGDSDSNNLQFNVCDSANQIKIRWVDGGSTSITFDMSVVAGSSQWLLVGVVRNITNNSLSVYFNGAFNSITSTTALSLSSSYDGMFLGREERTDAPKYFNGFVRYFAMDDEAWNSSDWKIANQSILSPDISPPNIILLNFTSDGGIVCANTTYTTFPSNCANTTDDTPTFSINTNEISACRMGVGIPAEYNLTNYNISCTASAGNLTHSCTQDFSLTDGFQNINFNCIDPLGNNQSIPLPNNFRANISITSMNTFLDNSDSERKYEYGSNVTINISAGDLTNFGICIYVDDTNVSCGTIPLLFNYTLHPIVKKIFNDSKNYTSVNISGYKGADATFNFSKEVDFGLFFLTINVTTPAGVRDLDIKINNTNQTIIVGLINGTQLFVDKFTSNNDNITLNYEREGSQTFNINMSVRGYIGGNISFRAVSTNKVELNYWQNFSNTSNINDSASNGDYINFSYENFNDNRTDLWNFFREASVGLSGESVIQPDNGRMVLTSSCSFGKEEIVYANLKNMNMSRFDKMTFKLNSITSCTRPPSGSSGTGTTRLFLTSNDEGTTEVEVDTIGSSSCGTTTSLTKEKNVAIRNYGNGIWGYTTDSGDSSNVTLLGDDVNLKFWTSSTCNSGGGNIEVSTELSVYGINVSGFGSKQLTNHTWNTSFNYTSSNLLNLSSSIISATIDALEVDDKFGSAQFLYFLSVNGQNWESVQKNQLHVFNNEGKNLSVRIVGNTTNTTTPIGISKVNVRVNAEQLANVSFDFGQDGIINVFVGGPINETNGTFSRSVNATFDINSYLFSGNCTGQTCLVPVTVISDNPGLLIVFNLSLEQQLNNITLNGSLIEPYCKNDGCSISLNMSSNSTTGNLNITALYIEYKGDARLNVTARTNGTNVIQDENTIVVRYSKFNITSPVPYFTFFPQNNNTKYLQPFGQDNRSNISIFNFTNLASTDNITIWLRLNQSLNSCLALYASNQSNLDNQKLVNTSYEKHIENITLGGNKSMYFWLNLTQCKPGTIAIQDPYNFFESSCDSCFQTWLK